MIELRPYQVKAINNVYRAIEDGHKKIILAAATAFGKTVTASHITRDAINTGLNVLFIVHMECLIDQTYNKMKLYDLEPGFIKSGYEEDLDAPIQIASVQTLGRREDWKNKKYDVIIIDEAHTTSFFEITKDIMQNVYPHAIYIGMTATTNRLGKEQLGDYYDVIINTPVPSDLQAQGFLASMRYFVPSPIGLPKLEDIKTVGDDYDPIELKNACDRPELVAAIVHEWLHNETIGAKGKRTLAFCVDIDHATHVAKAFDAAGVPAAMVTGSTPSKQRKILYDMFNKGEILVLTSVDVISIGFDEPSVEVGLGLRPTQSEALFLQQVGRILRISPKTGKTEGIFLDQAGNTTRHPKPEEIEYYTLPVSTPKKGGNGIVRMKECPMCDRLNYNFIQDCACGHHYISSREINENGMLEIEPGVTYSVAELKEKFLSYRREAFTQWSPPNQAEKRFAKEYGFSPLPEWYRGSVIRSQKLKDVYIDYLIDSAKELNKDEYWATKQFKLELEGVAA